MNLATALVAAAVAGVFCAIIASMIKNKKKGKPLCACTGCSGNCAGCGYAAKNE